MKWGLRRVSAVLERLPYHFNGWFALQVKARHERTVAAGLHGRGVACLLPSYRERRRWSDRVKALEVPLFPGYVFCELDRNSRLSALRTPGVVRVVGCGGEPHPLRTEEVENLKALSSGRAVAHPHRYLPTGAQVRLVDGPLAGMTGCLREIRGERRLVVSVDLLQRSIAVELNAASVRPVGLVCGATPC